MKQDNPLVSVIIPVYNDEKNVAAAIESALSQTLEDVEVIVVDDGSTDSTPAVLSQYRDRVNCIRQENRGLPGARNTGIRASRGKYLCFLDSDDVLLPRKAELQSAVMETEPDVGLTYGGWLDVNIETGETLRDFSYARPEHDLARDAYPPHFPVFSAMLRREWFDEVGLFDERLKALEDSDMWWRLWSAGCVFRRVKEPVARRGVRPGSMSQNIPEHSECALFANRLHLFRMGPRASRKERIRRLAAIWMKRAGYHISRGERDLALESLMSALRYDLNLFSAPIHWVPLIRQMDLKYPMAMGNGIESFAAAWRQLISLAEEALRKKRGKETTPELAAVKAASAYTMSRQAFSTGRPFTAIRWLFKALISGRGRVPAGVDADTLRRLFRQMRTRVTTKVRRIIGAKA
ncbi:MAG: glycosyltransferase, partial [Candidatus Coatesbacteria bacterium]|nr:glycosyltransferase [Candidatus Coatesbacteria bacterium]